MNLQQLYYFEEIAQVKNYTRAAETLSTTQSCLSHSIARLESELGLPLLVRKGPRIELTDFGRQFALHAKKITAELKLIEQERDSALGLFSSRLKIAFTTNLSHTYMPNLVRKFNETPGHPDILFSFVAMSATKPALEDIKKRDLDIAFGAKVEDPEICYHKLYDENLYIIVSNDSPYAKQSSFDLKDLARETLITYNYQCGTRYFINKLLAGQGVTPGNIMEMETENMIASAVSSNLGVGLIPQIQEIQHYSLKLLPLQGMTVRRPLYMMWKNDKFIPPAIRNFVNFVKATVEMDSLTQ